MGRAAPPPPPPPAGNVSGVSSGHERARRVSLATQVHARATSPVDRAARQPASRVSRRQSTRTNRSYSSRVGSTIGLERKNFTTCCQAPLMCKSKRTGVWPIMAPRGSTSPRGVAPPTVCCAAAHRCERSACPAVLGTSRGAPLPQALLVLGPGRCPHHARQRCPEAAQRLQRHLGGPRAPLESAPLAGAAGARRGCPTAQVSGGAGRTPVPP